MNIAKIMKLVATSYALYKTNQKEADAVVDYAKRKFGKGGEPSLKPWRGEKVKGATYHVRNPFGRVITTTSHAEATSAGMEYVGYTD